MYNTERIGKAIADIEKYLVEITSYNIQNADDLEEGKVRHAAAMLIFAILNRISDIGSEIISVEKLGAPSRYADIMPILAKSGIINKEQASALNYIIEKRNVIAHFYGDVSARDLFSLIKKLSTVEQFLKTIKKRISSKNK